MRKMTPTQQRSFSSLNGQATIALMAAFLIAAAAPSIAKGPNPSKMREEATTKAEALSRQSEKKMNTAKQKARARGWMESSMVNGNFVRLIDLSESGMPIYEEDLCFYSNITSSVTDLHQADTPITGEGVIVGIWDGGLPLPTHQEFMSIEGTSRVTNRDYGTPTAHPTAVSSVVAAAGINGDAIGSAPEAKIYGFNSANDASEMLTVARVSATETHKIQLSNHSYSKVHGWSTALLSGTLGVHWLGEGFSPKGKSNREDPNYGLYGDAAARFDEVCVTAPYYLPIRAAGNSRTNRFSDLDTGSGTFYYFDRGEWNLATYDPSSAPFDGDADGGGYDTIVADATAKNILTVGSISRAVANGERDLSLAVSSSFSSWGPADDGRIKPDLVAVGEGVRMAISNSVNGYTSGSGTSFSSPQVAGVGALLLNRAEELLEGTSLLSSSIKGLLIHGAVDLGNVGPDYQYGWGLVDAYNSIDVLEQHALLPEAGHLIEGLVTAKEPDYPFTVYLDGDCELRATLCWTDPAASPMPMKVDDPTRALINDLDLQVLDEDGRILQPWILDPSNPEAPAARGTNTVDNVEQVLVSSTSLKPGFYTVIVSASEMVESQRFSLIMTGQREGVYSPSVSSVTPKMARADSETILEFQGSDIPFGSTAELVDVAGNLYQGVALSNTPNSISVSFDLSTATAGNYQARLWSPTGEELILADIAVSAVVFEEDFDNYNPLRNWSMIGNGRISGSTYKAGSVLSLSDAASASHPVSIPNTADTIVLEFEAMVGKLSKSNAVYVESSTDGGATWTILHSITEPTNGSQEPKKGKITPTPETFQIQIPAATISGNQATIRFRSDLSRRLSASIDNIVLSVD